MREFVVDGRSWPPRAPDAITLPPPVWDEAFDGPRQRSTRLDAPHAFTARQQDATTQVSNGLGYNSYTPATMRSPVVSENASELPSWYTYPVAPPGMVPAYYTHPSTPPEAYRAPVLHARDVYTYIAEQPPTPHDTYKYPASHLEHIYVTQAAAPAGPDLTKEALARWYAEEVVELLVKPGSFRAGVGSAAEATWSRSAREREEWVRVGHNPPDYSRSWGRMGMETPAPTMIRARSKGRDLALDTYDPYHLTWHDTPAFDEHLVNFVLQILQRMTFSNASVIAAVWYLRGLRFHEGDGVGGSELREMLSKLKSSDADVQGIQKRVIVLGLSLSGKWFDDHTYLNKSWCVPFSSCCLARHPKSKLTVIRQEVACIPTAWLFKFESAALFDLCYSLWVSPSAWSDHVNQLFKEFDDKGMMSTDLDVAMWTILDGMIDDARATELAVTPYNPPLFTLLDRRPSWEVNSASDQHLFTRSWTRSNDALSSECNQTSVRYSPFSDADLERVEREVSALVDDEMDPDFIDDDDDDEEDFLDYDGATKWLPSMSDLRRSSSNTSAQSGSSNRSVFPPASQYIKPPPPQVSQVQPWLSRPLQLQLQLQIEPQLTNAKAQEPAHNAGLIGRNLQGEKQHDVIAAQRDQQYLSQYRFPAAPSLPIGINHEYLAKPHRFNGPAHITAAAEPVDHLPAQSWARFWKLDRDSDRQLLV
jgi:hypothetical protein